MGTAASRYVDALARCYAIATLSYAITHPSLPNYLALTSGSTQGITSDCTDCHVAGRNIVDELEAAHLSWKAYMEGLPGPCCRSRALGATPRSTTPSCTTTTSRVTRTVAGASWASATSPAMCGAARCRPSPSSRPTCATTPTTATSPQATASSRASSPATARAGPAGLPRPHLDEGSTDAGCCTDAHGGRIATIVAGPGARRGVRSSRPVDHYGVLHTVQRELGLASLGGAARRRSGTLDALLAHARVTR